jgi:hypothetical protein
LNDPLAITSAMTPRSSARETMVSRLQETRGRNSHIRKETIPGRRRRRRGTGVKVSMARTKLSISAYLVPRRRETHV